MIIIYNSASWLRLDVGVHKGTLLRCERLAMAVVD